MYRGTHSFTQVCTQELIHSGTHSGVHLFIHSGLHAGTHSFLHSGTHGTHSFIHSGTHSGAHPFIHSGLHAGTHSFILSGMHSLITVFSPSSTQVHPPALRFSPSPSLISPSLLRPSTVHAARTHALSTPRAHSSSAHHTFPPYDHVSSVASAPGRALAWGPEASANIDFGGGVLKVRGFRARTPQTPGFRGEGPEGAGRGVRGARLQALPSEGPQPGHQARRAAGAGRAGDPRPGAELTVWRAAHLWAARRPAHPGQQLRERGEGGGRRRRSGAGEGGAGLGRGCPSASRGGGLGAAETGAPGARRRSGPRGCGRLGGGRCRKLPEAWWQPGRPRGGCTRERIWGALGLLERRDSERRGAQG